MLTVVQIMGRDPSSIGACSTFLYISYYKAMALAVDRLQLWTGQPVHGMERPESIQADRIRYRYSGSLTHGVCCRACEVVKKDFHHSSKVGQVLLDLNRRIILASAESMFSERHEVRLDQGVVELWERKPLQSCHVQLP